MSFRSEVHQSKECLGGGGGTPYRGYIGTCMCSPKGYGFLAVLVSNRVSYFNNFGLKEGMVRPVINLKRRETVKALK